MCLRPCLVEPGGVLRADKRRYEILYVPFSKRLGSAFSEALLVSTGAGDVMAGVAGVARRQETWALGMSLISIWPKWILDLELFLASDGPRRGAHRLRT